MMVQKELGYAKINLFLDIDSIRDDGFHNIKTVMHSVSLADEITISVKPSSQPVVRLNTNNNIYLPINRRNLAYRAAALFLDKLGLSYEVNIKLVKNIPISAGLAGGSTDAAAVLRGLNKLFKKPMSRTALLELALSLGSDVPYCMVGKTALCEGRGEIMTPLKSPDFHVVIAIGNEHVAASDAYMLLDKKYSNFDGTVKTEGKESFNQLADYLAGNTFTLPVLYNIFETVILPICHGAEDIKKQLNLLGAEAVVMSGSGPSVFGIFSDEKAAREAACKITDLGYYAAYAKSV